MEKQNEFRRMTRAKRLTGMGKMIAKELGWKDDDVITMHIRLEKSPISKALSETTGVCQTCKGRGGFLCDQKDPSTAVECEDCKGTSKQSGEKGRVGGQQTECNHVWNQTSIDRLVCVKCGEKGYL